MSIAIVQNGIRLATSWEDVRLNLFGNPIAGVTAISYSESQEKQNFWGAGNEPQERGYGNKTYEASITLTAQTVQSIHDSLPPGHSITDIPWFLIPVFYKLKGGLQIVEHFLSACEFTGRGRSMSQNDGQVVEELELIPGKIFWSRAQMKAYEAGGVG